MTKSSLVKLALGAALAALGFAQAHAQDYPTKPITLILGYAPGASTDLMARFTAEHMSQLLGQRIIVENRPGANSAIATRMVARANPDGYTLLFSAFALASNLYGLKEPGYKLSDFVNIGGYGYTGYTLFVNTKSSGAKTAQEFIDFGRKNPGKLTYSSLGPSSPPNLVANHFDDVAKMGWREIPFKSAADAVSAVVSGTVDVYFAAPSTAMGSMGQPNISVFAVTGKERSPLLPNVPTFAEIGIPLNDSITLGVFAPAGTPQPIIDKLRKAMDDAKKNADNKKKIEATGLQVYSGTWQDFDRDMENNGKLFGADLKRLGIEAE
jgi:tripartite-type tricarboxylate transporter receptor subunit TctC